MNAIPEDAWPVWVIGYVMALLSWLHPVRVQIGNSSVEFYSKTSLGVIFALVVVVSDEADDESVVVAVLPEELIRPPPTSPNAPATTRPATNSIASTMKIRAGFLPLCGAGLT